MKNFMRIDTKKRQIIMDKTFYNRSLYFGTEEYDSPSLLLEYTPSCWIIERLFTSAKRRIY